MPTRRPPRATSSGAPPNGLLLQLKEHVGRQLRAARADNTYFDIVMELRGEIESLEEDIAQSGDDDGKTLLPFAVDAAQLRGAPGQQWAVCATPPPWHLHRFCG